MPVKKSTGGEPVPVRKNLKVRGFLASGISCGIKRASKSDLALILSESQADVAGVFTTNSVKAAPVLLDMKRVMSGAARGVVVNSGNANACTGKKGAADALAMASGVEKELGLKKGDILVSSTGVIGVPLPIDKIRSGIPLLIKGLSPDGFNKAAAAIMTTDAFPKTHQAVARIHGKTVTVAGVAKGAGMICPDMATMLAYLLTDANIRHKTLGKALREAVGETFNSIIVDNDTSTNDTVLAFANGRAGCAEIKSGTNELKAFTVLLKKVCGELSRMIVRDGEGATKVVEVEVSGAATKRDAEKAARTIAESLLVKTALFGGDPNWGRIIAALGRAGIRMREDKVVIAINGVVVAKNGLDAGREKKAAMAMKAPDVVLKVELNCGRHSKSVWTSDLTYDYVMINSAYRT